MHLLELGHLFDLPLVGVAAVAAARAFLAAEVFIGLPAGVRASRAEAPTFDLVEVGIHLIHLHAPALGKELAVGHQFADGDIGGALVAQWWQFLAAVAALAASGCFAPQHRLERDAGFGEGVVGQKAFIGEHRQQGPAFEFFFQRGKGLLLSVDLIFVVLLLLGEGISAGGVAVVFLPQLAGFSGEAFALSNQLLEPPDQVFGKGGAKGKLGWIEEHFGQRLLAGVCERLIKQSEEAFQQLSLLGLAKAEPAIGEFATATFLFAGPLHGIEHFLQLLG